MKVTFNLRSGVGTLSLEIAGNEDEIMAQVKEAIETNSILDLTDTKGDRVVIPASMIGYVLVPTSQSHRGRVRTRLKSSWPAPEHRTDARASGSLLASVPCSAGSQTQ